MSDTKGCPDDGGLHRALASTRTAPTSNGNRPKAPGPGRLACGDLLLREYPRGEHPPVWRHASLQGWTFQYWTCEWPSPGRPGFIASVYAPGSVCQERDYVTDPAEAGEVFARHRDRW